MTVARKRYLQVKEEHCAKDTHRLQSDVDGVSKRRFGDIMHDFQRERFNALCPALLALANGTKPPVGKYFWLGSKGTSKDTDLTCAFVWLLAFSKVPIWAQLAANDLDQAAGPRRVVEDVLRVNPMLASRIRVDKWKVSCQATASELEIIPADVSGSHGSRPSLVLVNELSHLQKQAFAENLLDNSAKVPHGVVILASNAGFLGTWQHEWYLQAKASPRWCVHEYFEPSPFMDELDVEDARIRNTPERFARLYQSVWSSNCGNLLDSQTIADAVVLQGPMAERLPGWSYLAGLDLGVSKDRAAVVMFGVQQGSNRISLAACKSWSPPKGGQIDLGSVERYIVQLHKRFHLLSLDFDPWQGVMMAQNLRRQNLVCNQMNFVGTNLNLMATTLLDVFASQAIDLYNDAELIRDLSRLSIIEKSYGVRVESTRDSQGHADLATAFIIALPAALKLAHQKAYTTFGGISFLSRGITATPAAGVQLSRISRN